MGKSKKPKAVTTGAVTEVATSTSGAPQPDPNLALFASYVRDDRKRSQEAKRAAREDRRRAEEAQQLVKAKDDAAAEVKRLRSRSNATADERAAADAAYRDALAAVVAEETGERPAWAPADATEPSDADAEPDAPAGSVDADPDPEQPDADQPDAGESDAGASDNDAGEQ